MEYQYKLILTNRRICKEFIITNNMSEVMLGTTADCIFRINQEYFFEKVQVSFQKKMVFGKQYVMMVFILMLAIQEN